MTIPAFTDLGLAEPLLRALAHQNFTTPTPIQAQAIPLVLAGDDVLGIAQTGTGKTAAFVLPILHRLAADTSRAPAYGTRALILAPTRELALQIDAVIRACARDLRLRSVTILGGVGRRPQVERMMRGTDIVVGTPGRVMDLMNTNELRLSATTCVVLDEADRMLDMGFIRDIRRIVASLPAMRQSLLFSATMPTEIARLADGLLRNPKRVEIAVQGRTAEPIDQQVHYVETGDKRRLLTNLLADPALSRVIVFTRTKHAANKVCEHLAETGIAAEALHGNKSQAARQKSLDRFRNGRARVLVATDIAARGIDVPAISHVVNFDLPNEAESYMHRIGRTARAGATGIALSFCDGSELSFLRSIERFTNTRLTVASGTPSPERAPPRPGSHGGRQGGPQQGRGNDNRNNQSRSPQAHAPRNRHPDSAKQGNRRRYQSAA